MAAPILWGRLEKCVLSAGKLHAHKFLVLGGVFCILDFLGGSADLFLWARGFFWKENKRPDRQAWLALLQLDAVVLHEDDIARTIERDTPTTPALIQILWSHMAHAHRDASVGSETVSAGAHCLGTRQRDHYERGLFTGGIARSHENITQLIRKDSNRVTVIKNNSTRAGVPTGYCHATHTHAIGIG